MNKTASLLSCPHRLCRGSGYQGTKRWGECALRSYQPLAPGSLCACGSLTGIFFPQGAGFPPSVPFKAAVSPPFMAAVKGYTPISPYLYTSAPSCIWVAVYTLVRRLVSKLPEGSNLVLLTSMSQGWGQGERGGASGSSRKGRGQRLLERSPASGLWHVLLRYCGGTGDLAAGDGCGCGCGKRLLRKRRRSGASQDLPQGTQAGGAALREALSVFHGALRTSWPRQTVI